MTKKPSLVTRWMRYLRGQGHSEMVCVVRAKEMAKKKKGPPV